MACGWEELAGWSLGELLLEGSGEWELLSVGRWVVSPGTRYGEGLAMAWALAAAQFGWWLALRRG